MKRDTNDIVPPPERAEHDDSLDDCKCGCAPNMASLFEMAQRRAKWKAAKREKEAALAREADKANQAATS